jgi:hypothetical protein
MQSGPGIKQHLHNERVRRSGLVDITRKAQGGIGALVVTGILYADWNAE